MFTAVVTPPGGSAREVTPEADTVSFSTLAVGGFGSCAFTVPLDKGAAISQLPKLSHVALHHGTQELWEGRIEDQTVDYIAGKLGLACFGYQRLLEENSVKRIWTLRGIPWQLAGDLAGTDAAFRPDVWAWSTIGRFDTADLTRSGLKFSAQTNQAAQAGYAHGAWYWTDTEIKAMLFDHRKVGNDPIQIRIDTSPNGSVWTEQERWTPTSTKTAVDVLFPVGTQYVLWIAFFSSNVAGANVAVEIENIRILGMQTTEEVVGGYYPQTLLTDLIALVPGLTLGVIDSDTSFAIPALARSQRDRALSVVQEITSYYQRRYGVWEDQKFHWRAVNLDEPQWVLKVADLTECAITSSVDNVAKTVYLEYADVATGLQGEKSAASSDRRNPYVKAGKTKDEVLAAPVGMTAASSQQMVNRVAADHGALPAVRGRVKLGAFTEVENILGTAKPACYIRAGENVVIPELPKSEFLQQGRDGETLFHVTASTTDMERDETSLELDGYSRSSDVLMARIAAATRVLTG